ncbi:hypothetical protein AYO38_07130 [bacterium SCGC AG-212-C10]|nr:hypothetical protein AYO38_07130 [bacterium SCGC AG-212-C10]
MDIRQVLKAQFSMALEIMEGTLGNCTQEMLDATPPGGGLQSLGVIAAHAAVNTDFFLNAGFAGGEMLLAQGDLAQRAGIPLGETWQTEVWVAGANVQLEPLREYLRALIASVDSVLSAATDEQLEREVPAGPNTMPAWQFLGVIGLVHLMQHGGEVTAIAGTMGVRGPY